MRRSNKITARGFKLAATAFSCILACGGGAVGQTLQPKGTPSAQPSAPSAGQPVSRGWVVSCDRGSAGLNCRAIRSVYSKKTKKSLVTVFVAVPAKTKKPTMVVRLPLGIYLPAGAAVQFGEGEAKPLLLERCGTSGCYGNYAITEADIAAMIKGADLTVSAQARNQTPLTYVLRAEGFAEAYPRIR